MKLRLKLDAGDAYRRKVARQNGWMVLLGLLPIALLGGVTWYAEAPSVWRFLVGMVICPTAFAFAGWLAIRWGSKNVK